MLELALPPDREALVLALSVRLRWYRSWRRRRGRSTRGAPWLSPRLFETPPLSLLPAVSIRERGLAQILRSEGLAGLWHLQIRTRSSFGSAASWEPRYYARARFDDSEWRILWIGEQWLAAAVHEAIRTLDRDAPKLPESSVRVVSSRAYQFTTLWIESADTHLVAHASRPLEARLPRLEYLPGDELQERLLAHFGDRLAREGIGGSRHSQI